MSRASHAAARLRGSALGITAGLISWLILVEITSGILQGYYVPLCSDIVIHLGIRDDGEFKEEVAVKVLLRGMDTDEILRTRLGLDATEIEALRADKVV